MLRLGVCGSEGIAQVSQDLLRLSCQVSFPYDIALGINSILPANVDRSCRSCDGDHLGKSRIFMQSLGVEMVYRALDWALFWILSHRGCLPFLNALGCVPHCLLYSIFQLGQDRSSFADGYLV